MISVVILYPKNDDTTFDMDYYTSVHMPMFAQALGDACVAWGVISVTSGKYVTMSWAMIESAEVLNAAMAEHGVKLMGDVPNFSNVYPEMIMGDVVA